MKLVLKTLLPALCCALLASACDVSPTDFDDPGATVESFPLTKVGVKDIHLFVAGKSFSTGYCLVSDSTSQADTIPGFDTLHTFSGNVKKINGTWYLDLALDINFPDDGVTYLFFWGDPQPQPRGFLLQIDSIEIGSEGSAKPGTCPDGSAQTKVAVMISRYPPYIEGWKDPGVLGATLKLTLHVEEESSEKIRVSGDFEMFSNIRKKDDHGGGYDDDEMLYSISGEIEME